MSVALRSLPRRMSSLVHMALSRTTSRDDIIGMASQDCSVRRGSLRAEAARMSSREIRVSEVDPEESSSRGDGSRSGGGGFTVGSSRRHSSVMATATNLTRTTSYQSFNVAANSGAAIGFQPRCLSAAVGAAGSGQVDGDLSPVWTRRLEVGSPSAPDVTVTSNSCSRLSGVVCFSTNGGGGSSQLPDYLVSPSGDHHQEPGADLFFGAGWSSSGGAARPPSVPQHQQSQPNPFPIRDAALPAADSVLLTPSSAPGGGLIPQAASLVVSHTALQLEGISEESGVVDENLGGAASLQQQHSLLQLCGAREPQRHDIACPRRSRAGLPDEDNDGGAVTLPLPCWHEVVCKMIRHPVDGR